MKRSYLAFLCFLALGVLTISGCGTVYKVAIDERGLGTQAKDKEESAFFIKGSEPTWIRIKDCGVIIELFAKFNTIRRLFLIEISS